MKEYRLLVSSEFYLKLSIQYFKVNFVANMTRASKYFTLAFADVKIISLTSFVGRVLMVAESVIHIVG